MRNVKFVVYTATIFFVFLFIFGAAFAKTRAVS